MSLVPIKVGYNLGQIKNNLEEVKRSVQEYCDDFKNVVVTEDSVKDGKQMLANIRKEKKALDDQRKAIKKAWNTPYSAFEKEVKEVLALYDTAIDGINSQINELEELRKEEKRADIAKIFLNLDKPEEVADWIRLDDIYDSKWENATCKAKDIKKEMSDAFSKLNMEYQTIKMMGHPYEESGIRTLKSTKDLQKAIQKMNDLMQQEEEIKAKKEALENAEPVVIPTPVEEKAVDDGFFADTDPMDGFFAVDSEPTYDIKVTVIGNDQLNALVNFMRMNGIKFCIEEV